MSNEGLKSQLQQDLTDARKARDKTRTLVLSTILSDVRNREIDGGGPLDDDGVKQVLTKAIKQRKDAATMMREGDREDLAAAEEAQSAILQTYLPPELSEDDVRGFVKEIVASGATQMGAVMGQLMPRIRGRFDGKEANRIVREELA